MQTGAKTVLPHRGHGIVPGATGTVPCPQLPVQHSLHHHQVYLSRRNRSGGAEKLAITIWRHRIRYILSTQTCNSRQQLDRMANQAHLLEKYHLFYL